MMASTARASRGTRPAFALAACITAVGCGDNSIGDGGVSGVDSGRRAPVDAELLDSGPRVYPDPPPAPTWMPDGIELEDGVGWRESTAPACSAYAGIPSADAPVRLVAGEAGVFLLLSVHNDTFGGFSPFRDGASVLHNDGSGWVTWLASPREPGSEPPRGLAAPVGDALWAVDSTACPLLALDGASTPRCLFDEERVHSAAMAEDGVTGWLLLGEELRRLEADGSTRVVQALEPPEQPIEVVREGDRVYALTTHSLYEGQVDGSFSRVLSAGGQTYLGMATEPGGAVWVASSDGITRYVEGVAEVTAEFPEGAPIRLWHDGDALYYIRVYELGRVHADGRIEVIATVGGERRDHRFEDIAGDRETGEVYLALLDVRFTEYECGPAMVIWFDGTRFRRF